MNQDKIRKECRRAKKVLGLSNKEVADASNVPKGTVDRFFGATDCNFTSATIEPIEEYLKSKMQTEQVEGAEDASSMQEMYERILGEKEDHNKSLADRLGVSDQHLAVALSQLEAVQVQLSDTREKLEKIEREIRIKDKIIIGLLLLTLIVLIIDFANPNEGWMHLFW